MIDIFDAAGIKKPDISILSEEFLLELKGMEHKNVALEVLKKLLNDEIKSRFIAPHYPITRNISPEIQGRKKNRKSHSEFRGIIRLNPNRNPFYLPIRQVLFPRSYNGYNNFLLLRSTDSYQKYLRFQVCVDHLAR